MISRLLIAVALIVGLAVVMAVVGYHYLNERGTKIDSQSKAYVEEIVPKFMANWDAKVFISNASPELLKTTSIEKINSLFLLFSDRLGKLVSCSEFKGEANFSAFPFSDQASTAGYIAQARFEKANGIVIIKIIQEKTKWEIREFRINSNALKNP